MKKYPGLYIVAVYFVINGVGGFYQLIPWIIKNGNSLETYYNPLLFNTGFLVAGIGLVWRRGWGRNFALFFNAISILHGLQHLLAYFVGSEPDTRLIVKAAVSFLLPGIIYFYLFKAKIKVLFDESHVSWIILGVVLFLYSQNQRVGNIIVDTFWAVMMIVSIAIVGFGTKQLRRNVPQDPLFMNKNI